MKKLLVILFLSGSFWATAQEKRTLETGDFHEVKLFDGISAELIPSDENKVVVYGEDSSEITLINKGGKLKIRMDINRVFDGYKTFAKIYHTQIITLIDANEESYISAAQPLKQVDLELRAQEGGAIDLDIEVQRLDVKSVTGGKIDLTGTAKNQDINVNTGGQYEADGLLTEQTTINVNAGGRAYVNASEYVEARVRAGGTIRIYGNPKVIDKKTFLGGKIIEQ